MRIFVTGSTGFVGSAVVRELIAGGHAVLGLTRSEAGRQALETAGAAAHAGSLQDLQSLRDGARAADAVIHLAFNHDFSRFEENVADDRRAIEAIGAELEGSTRPMLVTSGFAGIANGRVATEADGPAESFPRASEAAAQALAERGIRASRVRLAPSTHDVGDHGFIPHLIQLARETGVAAYVGDGENRWPGIHRRDAARLYRLAIEHGAGGLAYHATDEEGVPFRQIAEVIGRHLGVPTASKSSGDAAAHFDWFTPFASMDMAASHATTSALLGWHPRESGLLADIDQPAYFEGKPVEFAGASIP